LYLYLLASLYYVVGDAACVFCSKLCLELYSIGAPSIADKLRPANSTTISWDQFQEVIKGKPLRQKQSSQIGKTGIAGTGEAPSNAVAAKESSVVATTTTNASAGHNHTTSAAETRNADNSNSAVVGTTTAAALATAHIAPARASVNPNRISVASLLRPVPIQTDGSNSASQHDDHHGDGTGDMDRGHYRVPLDASESSDAVLIASKDEYDAYRHHSGNGLGSGSESSSQRRVSWGDKQFNSYSINSALSSAGNKSISSAHSNSSADSVALDMESGDEDDHLHRYSVPTATYSNASASTASAPAPAAASQQTGKRAITISVPKSPTAHMRAQLDEKPVAGSQGQGQSGFGRFPSLAQPLEEDDDNLRASYQSQQSSTNSDTHSSIGLAPPIFTATTPFIRDRAGTGHSPNTTTGDHHMNASTTKPPLHASMSRSSPISHNPTHSGTQSIVYSSLDSSGHSSKDDGSNCYHSANPEDTLMIPLPPLSQLSAQSGVIVEGWLDKKSANTGMWLSVSVYNTTNIWVLINDYLCSGRICSDFMR
jgi:hypothetical protein